MPRMPGMYQVLMTHLMNQYSRVLVFWAKDKQLPRNYNQTQPNIQYWDNESTTLLGSMVDCMIYPLISQKLITCPCNTMGEGT